MYNFYGDILTSELGFRVGFSSYDSSWMFELDFCVRFRIRILNWIFELGVELNFGL